MKIIIEEFQTDWVNDFLEQKVIIDSTLIDVNPITEHIGSTSVVGLCAKPTIDILVGLQAENQLDKTISPMINQGYTYFRKYEPGDALPAAIFKLEALNRQSPSRKSSTSMMNLFEDKRLMS